MKPKKLSVEMTRCLAHAKEHDSHLVRSPGGFWAASDARFIGNVPHPYFGTTTVEALVNRGEMEYTDWQRSGVRPFPIQATVKEASK